MSIPFGKRQALHEILLNYANDDASTTTTTIDAILGLLDCDGSSSPTLRDQFAMAALQGRLAAGYMPDHNRLREAAVNMYEMADAMLEARKK